MRHQPTFRAVAFVAFVAGCASLHAEAPPTAEHPWRALHVISYTNDEALDKLGQQIPQLARMGINCLILEVNYGFEFESHPELRQSEHPITKAGAKKLLALCRENGVELVPQFMCLGHQSWAGTTFPLLAKYPELDLTPGAFPNNKGLYCREWDPMNPKTNEIAFALIGEIADAFEARAFHVGMDEVFLLRNKHATSTKDLDPADVFAKAVTDIHAHVVDQRGLTMLMWADRLIDGRKTDLGEWEASQIGTAPAIDKIPKDIILCPWHYELRKDKTYVSIPMFMEKGFRVLPSSWKNTEAALDLIRDAQAHQTDGRLVGHIFTTWGSRRGNWADFEPLYKGLALLQAPAAPKPE